MYKLFSKTKRFQLTAARRRLGHLWNRAHIKAIFQLTAARRRLEASFEARRNGNNFNSQPREGGWKCTK